MSGGCITRQWGATFEVSDQVMELISEHPSLIPAFERLYARHDRRMPPVMRWGDTLHTVAVIDQRRMGSILTSCTRGKGIHSSCWFTTGRRDRRS